MLSPKKWVFCLWLLLSSATTLLAQDSLRHALLTQLRQARTDTGRVSTYLQLARFFSYQQPDSSLLFATRGYTLAGHTGQSQKQASLRMWMGCYYKKTKSRNDSLSLRYLNEALSLARDSLVRAEVLYVLGTQHYDAGQLQRAASLFIDALRLVGPGPEVPPRQFVPVLTQLLGMIYLRLGQHQLARQYLHQGLQAVNRQKRPSMMAELLLTDAEVLEAQHQASRALPTYRQALVYARKADGPHLIATALNGIGRYWLSQHNSNKAIVYFRMALPLAWRGLDRSEDPIIDTYNNLAMGYIQAGQTDSAVANAQRAFSQAHRLHRVLLEEKSLTTLIEARMLNNDHAGSMAALHQVQQLRDHLFSADQVRAVAEVERRYELEKREQALRLKETELAYQQRLRWLFTAIAGLLLVLLLTGIFLYRRLWATKQKLAGQITLVEQQANELQAVNQIKDKLFSILGHELRAPIVSLKTTLSLFRQNVLSHISLNTHLDRLQRELDNYYPMLDNLLYWSTAQQQGLVTVPQRVELAELVEDALDLFAQTISTKKIEIVNDVTNTGAWADENQSRIVVRNIIQNALKFTPVHQSIFIVTEAIDQQIILTVRDTGQGMTETQLARLFGEADLNTGTMGEHGSGFGLSLCRTLLARNQGELQVTSTPGNGTTVHVWLPRFVDVYEPVTAQSMSAG